VPFAFIDNLDVASDGSIYYRIAKFPSYGKLSKIDVEGMMAGARVDNDEYDKADARDFVLWKAPKEGEPFWETEIGPGRPITHMDPATQSAILAAADRDFVEGIRISLGTAILVLALVLAAGYAWFPKGRGGIADVKREAGALEKEEVSRAASPESAGLG